MCASAACSDSGPKNPAPGARRPAESGDARAARPADGSGGGSSDLPPAPTDAITVTAFPVAGKEHDALQSAGVVSAWDAVIDRWRYLARREQRGAVFGRLGDLDGAYRWLVDETEGAGSLAIRVAIPKATEVAAGDRVVIHGAWRVDAGRKWYWQAERIFRLPSRERDAEKLASDPYRGLPGQQIRVVESAPEGAVPVSEMTERGGGIRFQVVRAPALFGDGWEISDRSDWRPVAILRLPGEHKPYGGQDYMTAEERWHLKKGVGYAVRVHRWRPPRQEGELPELRATSAPLRIEPRAERSKR